MTFEVIFAVVTVVITGILGTFFKNTIVPSRFIPIQNLIIGIIAAVVAVYFNLFNDIPTAIIMSLAVAFSVGGAYDATQIRKKSNTYKTKKK